MNRNKEKKTINKTISLLFICILNLMTLSLFLSLSLNLIAYQKEVWIWFCKKMINWIPFSLLSMYILYFFFDQVKVEFVIEIINSHKQFAEDEFLRKSIKWKKKKKKKKFGKLTLIILLSKELLLQLYIKRIKRDPTSNNELAIFICFLIFMV